MTDYGRHFADIAPRYDALRREATDDVADWLIARGGLCAGQQLLDVGCGTGAMAALLAHRADMTVVGVDPSPQMLAVARERAAGGCRFERAGAEALPFAGAAFHRVLMQTVVHLIDRPRAFGEAHRVLRAGGALLVATVDPAGADAFWLAEWFPSYPAIDRARFPSVPVLREQLADAGFGATETSDNPRRLAFTRDHALDMLRARFASSFAVIDDAEYEAGLARAQREMPDAFATTLRLVCVAAWKR